MNPKIFFHKLSYLQYPIIVVSFFFVIRPYIVGFDTIWENYNIVLILFGLSISFSTLQDTSTTQNEISRKVWESPKKGQQFIVLISVMTFAFILMGLYGLFFTKSPIIIKELSLGLFTVGISLIGLLKAAIEMFENHRKDKN